MRRAHGFVVVQQLALGIAAVLPTVVEVHEQIWGGERSPKYSLQGAVHQFLGHSGSNLPTDHIS
jgi:hypothetical protein